MKTLVAPNNKMRDEIHDLQDAGAKRRNFEFETAISLTGVIIVVLNYVPDQVSVLRPCTS